VYTFTKLHDRRIPNVGVGVRVGVGPVEFQFSAALERSAPVFCVVFLPRPSDPLCILQYQTGPLGLLGSSSEVTAGQRESCYADVFKFLAPKR